MAKLMHIKSTDGTEEQYMFFCPGCKCGHAVRITAADPRKSRWAWNGSLEKPTFTPSILTWSQVGTERKNVCHSFVTDGTIQFLGDCHHSLKGQTVEIPEWDDACF